MSFKKFVRVSLLLAVLALFSGCVVVEDGTVGVSKSFGKISDDPLTPGIYPNIPVVREIEVWNVKTQPRVLNLELPSEEKLIVRLQATILFRPENVVELRKTIGPSYVSNVLDAVAKDIIREVVGKRTIEFLVVDKQKLTEDIAGPLTKSLAERGIVVENVLISNLGLPETFRQAVERKLESEQKALQKEFELRQATKDAEIEVARAEGAAKAQKIVRSTLSSEYLQYLWIKTLNENPNVIYVATEANMPMFRSAPAPEAGGG